MKSVPALPTKSLAAFYVFGAPACAFAFTMLVAVVIGITSDNDGISAIVGLVSFAAPLPCAIYARSLLIKGGLLLRVAKNANTRGDAAAAREACLRVLRTVYRADLRTVALYELATALAGEGALGQASSLFLEAKKTLPASVHTRAAQRVFAFAGAQASIHLATLGRLGEAESALVSSQQALDKFHGPMFANPNPHGSARLDAVLGIVEDTRDPRPRVLLATAYLALKRGDMARAAAIIRGEEPALFAPLLAPRERELFSQMLSAIPLNLRSDH